MSITIIIIIKPIVDKLKAKILETKPPKNGNEALSIIKEIIDSTSEVKLLTTSKTNSKQVIA